MPFLKWGLVLLLPVFGASSALAASVTASFDEIDASGGDVPIVSPYLGLTWTNFTAYTTTPGFAGFNNGIVSQANAAYSGGETAFGSVAPVVGSIASASGSFDFVSADLGAGYYDGLSLTAEGRRNGAVLFTRTLTLDTTGAQAFSFNFSGIDTLTFTGAATVQTKDPFACGLFDCTQFTLDNVKLVVTPVPEPGSLALMIGGLAVLGTYLTARRRLPRD